MRRTGLAHRGAAMLAIALVAAACSSSTPKTSKGTLASTFVFGAPPDCATNKFCQIGLKTVYGIEFKEVKSLDFGGPTTRAALTSGAVQVGELFSTSIYDPTTGQWTTISSMNVGRQSAPMTLLQNGKVLVAGGFTCCPYGGISRSELYDPDTRGGDAPDGRRPKATLHWLSAKHAVPAQVRLYDRLFTRPDPGADGDVFDDINPDSETVLEEALVEPALAELPVGETVQFERLGYFCPDRDSTSQRLVFNRTLGLKDTWARLRA